MYRIIFATGNQGKMKEIRQILEGMKIHGEDAEILSMKEAGIDVDIAEDGETFEDNAVIKARAVAQRAPESIVLSDDSGLEIDYLGGEPGIYSARYLGEDTPYSVKNADLLRRLEGVADEERTARFVCAIAAVFPDGSVLTERATIEGRIDYAEKGEHGFGYDPIFLVPELGRTTAELSEDDKNKISHRGKALRAIRKSMEAKL